MKLKLGDMVRYNGRGVLMTVGKFLANGKVVCAWFRGNVYRHHAFPSSKLVKEKELSMTCFTVEVHFQSRYSWKIIIKTHLITAYTSHEARRKALEIYLGKRRQVLSTQIVDRYPKGV